MSAYKIFISSPGDVARERHQAEQVIRRVTARVSKPRRGPAVLLGVRTDGEPVVSGSGVRFLMRVYRIFPLVAPA
jgi:hypothetical protein